MNLKKSIKPRAIIFLFIILAICIFIVKTIFFSSFNYPAAEKIMNYVLLKTIETRQLKAEYFKKPNSISGNDEDGYSFTWSFQSQEGLRKTDFVIGITDTTIDVWNWDIQIDCRAGFDKETRMNGFAYLCKSDEKKNTSVAQQKSTVASATEHLSTPEISITDVDDDHYNLSIRENAQVTQKILREKEGGKLPSIGESFFVKHCGRSMWVVVLTDDAKTGITEGTLFYNLIYDLSQKKIIKEIIAGEVMDLESKKMVSNNQKETLAKIKSTEFARELCNKNE